MAKSSQSKKSIDPFLSGKSLADLRKIAKAAGLEGYGKLSKDELAEKLDSLDKIPYVYEIKDTKGKTLGFCLPEDRAGICTAIFSYNSRKEKHGTASYTSLDKERLKNLKDKAPQGYKIKESPK